MLPYESELATMADRVTMNRAIALSAAFLGFAHSAFATDSNAVLSPEGPLALKAAQASQLFKQCSRRAPDPRSQLWFPTAADVKAFEAKLEKHMKTIEPGTWGAPAAGEQYRGQYAGFMRGNVKYIYAAYVPARYIEFLSKHCSSGDAIQLCDGGPYFWGIVYNTATGEFSELEANGR